MSISALLLAASLFVPPAAAAAGSAAAPQMIMRGGRRPPLPEAVVGEGASLPLSFTAGLPTLEAKINGKGPFKLGFDTGAPGGPHLTTRVVEALGLQPIGEAMASDPSGSHSVAMKLYRLNSVAFGGVSANGWIGSARPARPGKTASLDGVVGLDAFAGYVVTIDYPHARFSLRRGALPPADGKTVFSYEGRLAPSAPLTVEGRTIAADIDTGNTISGIIVPADFAEGLRRKGEAKASGVAHTVSNTIQMFSLPIEGVARVGTTPLAVSVVGYPSLIPVANIGSLALTRTVVQIDPAHQRLSLSRPK